MEKLTYAGIPVVIVENGKMEVKLINAGEKVIEKKVGGKKIEMNTFKCKKDSPFLRKIQEEDNG